MGIFTNFSIDSFLNGEPLKIIFENGSFVLTEKFTIKGSDINHKFKSNNIIIRSSEDGGHNGTDINHGPSFKILHKSKRISVKIPEKTINDDIDIILQDGVHDYDDGSNFIQFIKNFVIDNQDILLVYWKSGTDRKIQSRCEAIMKNNMKIHNYYNKSVKYKTEKELKDTMEKFY